jgi:hypothetical protein
MRGSRLGESAADYAAACRIPVWLNSFANCVDAAHVAGASDAAIRQVNIQFIYSINKLFHSLF